MSAIILAGGASRRLGRDKALVTLDSATLLDLTLRAALAVVKNAIIVASDTGRLAAFRRPAVDVVRDLIPHQGPLVGLLTGLEATADEYNLVLSCDAPFVRPAVLEYLLAEAVGYDATVVKTDGRMHPLLGVYRRSCSGPIRSRLDAGDRKVISFFPDVKINAISDDSIKGCDPQLVSLFNINTRSDLDRARRLYEGMKDRHGQDAEAR